jgi:hypothetical protein
LDFSMTGMDGVSAYKHTTIAKNYSVHYDCLGQVCGALPSPKWAAVFKIRIHCY